MKNKYLKLTSLSERRFRAFLRLFAADIPALKTARLTGLSYVTAHRLYTLLRGRIVGLACAEARAFSGEIEVDESYFGVRLVRGKRGRGAGVLGVHKRGDRVFLSVVRNCPEEEACLGGPGHASERRLHRRVEGLRRAGQRRL